MERLAIPFNKEEMTAPKVILNRSRLESLQESVMKEPVFDHPFLIKLSKGAYSERAVKYAFIQFSKHVEIFTNCLSALMATSPTIRDRMVLMDNLQEEMGAGQLLGAHYMLYLQMLHSMGISNEEIDRTPALIALQVLNDALGQAVRKSFICGLSWLGIGGELTIPNNFPYLAKAAKSTFAAIDTGFFERHGARDDGHNCDTHLLLAMHIDTDEDFRHVENEVRKSLWLRAAVWEELAIHVSSLDGQAAERHPALEARRQFAPS